MCAKVILNMFLSRQGVALMFPENHLLLIGVKIWYSTKEDCFWRTLLNVCIYDTNFSVIFDTSKSLVLPTQQLLGSAIFSSASVISFILENWSLIALEHCV